MAHSPVRLVQRPLPAAPRSLAEAGLDSLPDAVVCVDLAGRITFTNIAAQRLTGWRTCQVNEALASSRPSLARTVTVLVPAAVGLPVISPLVALMASPAGRPVALKVSALPSGSVAMMANDTGSPRLLTWFAGVPMTGAALAELPFESPRQRRPNESIALPERP